MSAVDGAGRIDDPADVGAAGYPEALRALVDERLAALRFRARTPDVAGLEDAMRYSLLAGGKRVRPVLALATARALGRPDEDVLPLGLALELIHTYSLIHDDLPAMDDDALRRGRPTCHVVHGDDVAILAGDALYAEAFSLLLHDQRGEPANVLAAARELAAATGVDGMVGGQYLDVAGVAGTREELALLHRLKTGRLIAASVDCVVLLHGLGGERRAAFARFAAELGVLFQVVDDILDVTGSDEDLGKPRGSDERHGKRTYVTEYGLPGAVEVAEHHHDAALEALRVAAPDGAPDLAAVTGFVRHRSS